MQHRQGDEEVNGDDIRNSNEVDAAQTTQDENTEELGDASQTVGQQNDRTPEMTLNTEDYEVLAHGVVSSNAEKMTTPPTSPRGEEDSEGFTVVRDKRKWATQQQQSHHSASKKTNNKTSPPKQVSSNRFDLSHTQLTS